MFVCLLVCVGGAGIPLALMLLPGQSMCCCCCSRCCCCLWAPACHVSVVASCYSGFSCWNEDGLRDLDGRKCLSLSLSPSFCNSPETRGCHWAVSRCNPPTFFLSLSPPPPPPPFFFFKGEDDSGETPLRPRLQLTPAARPSPLRAPHSQRSAPRGRPAGGAGRALRSSPLLLGDGRDSRQLPVNGSDADGEWLYRFPRRAPAGAWLSLPPVLKIKL